MITKERLKELLDECKTVYTTETRGCKSDYIGLILYNSAKFTVKDNNTVRLFIEDTVEWHWYKLENIFETKEDAMWQSKFNNITRVETLKLPTWAEFLAGKFISFSGNNGCGSYLYHILDKYVEIKCYTGSHTENVIFIQLLNKQNYIKACELAKSLFLGEMI